MPLPLIPILLGVGLGGCIAELFDWGRNMLGDGEKADKPPQPPVAPPINAGSSTDAEQDRNKKNAENGKEVDGQAKNGENTQDQAEANSAEGRTKLDQILEELKTVAGRNNSPDGGATPETQANTDNAVRNGLQQLRDTIGGTDAANRGLAGGLPGLGGMNPLGALGGGMPGMPAMGGGMNPFSALGGGGAPAGPAPANPLAMDSGSAGPTPATANPLANPGNEGAGPGPAPVSNPLETHPAGNQTATDPAHPGDPAKPDNPLSPQPDNPALKEVVSPDGEKTTAPDETAAAALRHAMQNPGAANQAASSYAAAGINLPADGADPGELVSSSDIKPGDIARWDDPPRDLLVWGNGKVIDSSGKLADLNSMLSSGVFNAFFRPTRGQSATTAQPVSHAAPETPVPVEASS